MEPHALSELRSLRLHQVLASRLSPEMIATAAMRLERWARTGTLHPHYQAAWRELLSLPLAALAAKLVSDDEEMRALRQVSPFSGLIDPRARWRIWAEARAELEGVDDS